MTRRGKTIAAVGGAVALLLAWNPGRFATEFVRGFARGMRGASEDQSSGVRQAGSALGAGEAFLYVPDGRLWYKKSGSGSGMPLILIHGGPGFSSVYLKPLEALGDERPVIRYDQLGAGKSDRIADTALFNVQHFVRELDSLRSALGYERVHLLGHSWGTILAFEYYRAHPEHVASLIFSSSAFDIPAWQRNARRLVTTLSDSAQQAIRVAEKEKKFDSPGYQDALEEFYGRYVWRHPNEADLDTLFGTANEAIYNYMQGPSEFTISGTLRRYDATTRLGMIRIPTLFTVGEFDEANPVIVKAHASLVPGARVEVIPGAAHLTSWDNPGAMLRAVRPFLRRVDSVEAKLR